jgi:hypothetical protein
MDDALELADYLPLSFKTPKEEEYIAFLWDAYETNYVGEKYQFAFLAYHMLAMSFVYFNIWQIKRNRPQDFLKATYGFPKRTEDTVLSATSPFTFSEIGESEVFRFLKLINCDNGKIGSYTKLVKDRNASAHTNGIIHYSDRRTLDLKVSETLRVVDEIQKHSDCVIKECYEQFLINDNEPDYREYPDAADQIREILIHQNYLSKKDLDICLGYDITELEDHPHWAGIESLHNSLKAIYQGS